MGGTHGPTALEEYQSSKARESYLLTHFPTHLSTHLPPPPVQDVSIAQDYSDLLALMLPTSLTYLHITNACHLMMYNAITSRCGEAGLAGQCRICVLGAWPASCDS